MVQGARNSGPSVDTASKTLKFGRICDCNVFGVFFSGRERFAPGGLLRIKAGAAGFLKRQSRTVAALAGPAASDIRQRAGTRGRRRSQPDTAGFDEREFREFLRLERTCASVDRIAVLRRRPVVRPGDLCAVEEPAGSSLDARDFRTDL